MKRILQLSFVLLTITTSFATECNNCEAESFATNNKVHGFVTCVPNHTAMQPGINFLTNSIGPVKTTGVKTHCQLDATGTTNFLGNVSISTGKTLTIGSKRIFAQKSINLTTDGLDTLALTLNFANIIDPEESAFVTLRYFANLSMSLSPVNQNYGYSVSFFVAQDGTSVKVNDELAIKGNPLSSLTISSPAFSTATTGSGIVQINLNMSPVTATSTISSLSGGTLYIEVVSNNLSSIS